MSTVPTRKAHLLVLFVGLLVGIVGTVAVMSRSHPGAQVQAEAHPQAPHAASEDTKIVLSAEAKESAGIRVEPARMLPMGESLTVPGIVDVSPNREAKITPPVSGKIARLLVKLGDTVRPGQPLLTLNSFDVAQAEAAVKQASAGIDQAEAALKTSGAEVAQAQAGIAEAEAELEQARTKQRSAETALGRQKELAAAGAFSQAPLQAAQSEMSEAQSELLKAQTDLQAHTVVLQRSERLFKEELISRADWEQAQLEQQQDKTQVARATSRVDIARQALNRERKVSQGDLLSKQAVQTSEAEVRVAEGEVQKAQQGVFRARQDLHKAQTGEEAARTFLRGATATHAAARANFTALAGSGRGEGSGLLTLYAPMGGTVSELHATLGEAVERSTLLCTVENIHTVVVNASVSEKDVARIRMGQACEVTVPAYPGQPFPGVVQTIASHVDEKTRALSARCLVQNTGGRLKPEMFAKVALGVGTLRKALSVPVSALDEDGDAHYLYVEEEGGYERRRVEVGRKTDTRAEILSGVKPDEKVVTAGIFVLKSESKKGQLKGDSD